MASFSDNLKAASLALNSTKIAATSMETDSSVMTLEEPYYDGLAYSGETWTADKNHYRWFEAYVDENYSTIDEKKNIVLNENQLQITQEENSQFIPFEMSRYYDGIDLMNTTISIHYDRSDGQHGVSEPVNVEYSDDKIRFSWLADASVTGVSGKLKFEIHAVGSIIDSNGTSYGYTWKTRSNNTLEVLQSLCGTDCGGTIDIDSTWVQNIVKSVSTKVAEQFATTEFGAEVEAAQTAANEAKAAAEDAKSAVDSAKAELSETVASEVASKVETAMSEYYTKGEVDTLFDNFDISDQLVDLQEQINEIDDLSKLIVNYDSTTNVLSFYNEETLIKDIQLDNTPNEEWVTTYSATIDEKITTALLTHYTKEEVDELLQNVDVSTQLETLKTELETKITTVETNYTAADAELAGRISTLETTVSEFDGLSAFDVTYTEDTKTLSFYNGETLIKDIVLNTNPSVEWEAAYDSKVDTKISDALTPVNEKIGTIDTSIEAINTDLDELQTQIDNLPKLEGEYYNKEDVNTLLEDKADKTDLSTLSTKVNVIEGTANSNKTNVSTISNKLVEIEERMAEFNTDPTLTYDVNYEADTGLFTFYELEKDEEPSTDNIKKQFTITGGSGGASTSTTVEITRITSTPLVITKGDSAIIKYNFKSVDASGDDTGEGTATWKVGSTVVGTSMALQGENTFDLTNYVSVGTQKVTLSIVDAAGTLAVKTWTVQVVDIRLETTFNDTYTYPLGEIEFPYTPYGSIEKTVHFILDGTELESVKTSVSGVPTSYTLPSKKHGAHLLETYITAEVNGSTIETEHIFKDILWYDETSDVPVIGTTSQNISVLQYDNANIVYTVYDPTTETPTVILAVDGEVISTQTLESPTNTWQFKSSEIGVHNLTITCGKAIKRIKVTVEKLNIDVTPVTAGLAFDFNPSGYSNNDADRLWSDGDVAMTVSDNFDWINGGYQLDENGDQYFCIKAGTSAEINYKLFADDAKKNGKEFKLVFKTTNVAVSDAKFLSCIDNTTGSDHIGIEMFVRHADIYGSATEYLKLPCAENNIIELEFNINKNTEAITEIVGYEDGVSSNHLVYDDSYNFTQSNPKNISLGSEHCDLHIYRFKVYTASLSPKNVLSNFIADARSAAEMLNRYKRNQIYNENGALTAEYLAEACPHLRIVKVEAPYFTNKKSDKVNNSIFTYIHQDGDKVLDNWSSTGCVHSGQGTSSDNYGGAGRNLDLILKPYKDYGNVPVIKLSNGEEVSKVSFTRTSVPINYINIKVNIASSNNTTNPIMARRFNKFNPYKRPFVREEGYDTSIIKDTMEFHNCVVFIKESDPDVNTHREFADNDWHFYAIGNIGDSKKTDKTRLTDPDDRYECIVEIMDVEYPLSDFPKGDEAIAILEAEKFDEKGTYGWRYIWEDGTDEENEEVFNYCKQKWIDFYKFVVNSTDEEFKAGLSNYMVVDSALYYYLFTTRYTQVDNRAKNSFWHYGWTGEYDSDGNKIRKWDLNFGYDMDTSLGLNNYGDLVYRYGLEDTDVDEKGEEIFRESDSTFFCRLRDLFADEARELYNSLESQGAWSSVTLLQEIREWQDEFPEALWAEDIQKKYIDSYTSTFINGAGDQQFLRNMAHGKCKYAIIDYETNQESYMASKFQSSFAASDNSVLRCTVPSDDYLVVEPNYKLKLTPYSYMYLNVKYGTQHPIQVRAIPGVEYEIPFDGDGADIIDIYSSSYIQSFGDLSSCYAATIDTAKAKRIKELIIGNDTPGYDNPYLTTLTTGANSLLEVLNIENVSGLTQSLNLTALANLRELYAHGSNIGGVTFANGGLIEIAELPAINAMTMRNLMYLTTLDIVSFDRLTTLTVENCKTVDLVSILQRASNVNRVRLTGVDWTLSDTSLLEDLYKMAGIDKNGYNISQSVLTGKVYVPSIGQQDLYRYQEAWSDLEIVYSTLIAQYTVTFKNDDGTILDVQNVNIGEAAIDPTTREENPIAIPTKESTAQYDYTFKGWDLSLSGIFADRVITAIYDSKIRSYTIKYVSKGTVLQEDVANYGDVVLYRGGIPTYTLEESAFVFYLFNRWDKSGFVDGNKTVNAIYDSCSYLEGYFQGKELKDLTPVEIYALTKSGVIDSVVEDKDPYNVQIGHDYDFDDVESRTFISEPTVFDGTNCLDTGISLFDIDRDFVFAIDYKMKAGNTTGATMCQCYNYNGANGFRLWYNTAPRITWGTQYIATSAIGTRNLVVFQHKKGDPNITVYEANSLNNLEPKVTTLEMTKMASGNNTLVFGCARADDGIYENYCMGTVYWSKLWFGNIGDELCNNLALWTHQTMPMEVAGLRKYYLSDNSNQRCSFTLIASYLLDQTKQMNSTATNAGGWKGSELCKWLNERVYKAFPTQIRALMKQCKTPSSLGEKSSEIIYADCHVTIPSYVELVSTTGNVLIEEGSTISFMTTNEARGRTYLTEPEEFKTYWYRSPYVGNNTSFYYFYVWYNASNNTYNYNSTASASASDTRGVLIMISF